MWVQVPFSAPCSVESFNLKGFNVICLFEGFALSGVYVKRDNLFYIFYFVCRRIEVVITRTTRNVVSRVELWSPRVHCRSGFAGFWRFYFLANSKRSSKKNLIRDRLTRVS